MFVSYESYHTCWATFVAELVSFFEAHTRANAERL
jgi:hypothetical protein